MSNISEDAEREKLREIKAVYENAVNTNQMELLRPYLADSFSFVTLTKTEFTNFDSFIKQWDLTRERLLQGGTYEISLQPDASTFEGDVAISKGSSTSTLVTGKKKTFQFSESWTAISKKQNGEWKVVRIHSSIDPFKNPFIIDQVKSLMIKTSIVALAIGVLIGYLISFTVK